MKHEKLNLFTNKLFDFFSLMFVCVFLSGAGYSGRLPDLQDVVRNRPVPVYNPPVSPYAKNIILPLAPSKAPDHYAGTIIKKGKYNAYLQDVKEFIPILESLKSVIKEKNSNKLQLFSSKTHLINVYVNYLNEKYAGKPEQNFQSFKQIIRLNNYLTQANEYWYYTAKYNKYLRGSVKDMKHDNAVINKKLGEALVSIDKVLVILKTNVTN